MNYEIHASRGPVSSMPGSLHSVPEGAKCDNHPRRPAVRRVQGETDSMGCEYHLECQRCVNKSLAYRAKLGGGDHLGFCSCSKDSANREQVPLFALRDYDEGSSGPLYYKCLACKTEWRRREAQEAEAYYAERGDDYFCDDSIHDIDDDDDLYGPEDEEPRPPEPPRPAVVTYKRRRKFAREG